VGSWQRVCVFDGAMESTLKPVVAAPVAAPGESEDLSSSQAGEPLSGYVTVFRSKATGILQGLRLWSASAAEAVMEKISSSKQRLSSEVCSLQERASAAKSATLSCVATARTKAACTVDYGKNKAADAAGFVKASFAKALSAMQEARATSVSYAALLKGKLLAAYDDLGKKGVKAWVAGVASDAVAGVRSAAALAGAAAGEKLDAARRKAVEQASGAAEFTKAKASAAAAGVHGVASDGKFQATAASAASGAVALGASGGAAGLAAGGALGAAVGVLPALFTFGLSIPGGAGLVAGATVGGAVGAVGAGAAGYGVYSKKEDIGRCAEYVKGRATETSQRVRETSAAALGRAVERANGAADFAKARVHASAGYVAEKASVARTRLVGRSGTGGTEATD